MKTAESLPLRGLVLALLTLVLPTWSCSGAPDAQGGSNMGDADEAQPKAMSMDDVTNGEQDPQDPLSEQRRRALLETSLLAAERSFALKDWEDVIRNTSDVLSLDRNNERAQNLQRQAQRMMGGAGDTSGQDFVIRAQIAQEQARYRASEEMQLGDALVAQGRYGDAVERYERAKLTLELSPFATADSALMNEIATKLERTQQRRAQAMKDAEESRRAASVAELEAERRRRDISRREKIARLATDANLAFQHSRFPQAVESLDKAIALDPSNPELLALHDLSSRALHENRVEILRQRWKAEWSQAFDGLRSGNVPQTESIRIDPVRWRDVVSTRQPLQFTSPESLDDPAERAIRDLLDETIVEHRFANATIQDWARHYQSITEVNFFVHPDVAEADGATLTDFSLPSMPVSKALDVICRQGGIKWRVNNGFVELLSGEVNTGRTYLVPYEVNDIVLGVRDKRGPSIKLRPPGEEFEEYDEDDPAPTVVDEGRLEGLITNNIAPDTWDEIGVLRYQNGVFLIRHTREVHAQVAKLLADLRQAVGIQVDIEARFLKVEDSFLEDVGVDFRGLGNQAAEGIPGRGLENRPTLSFDDFGRPETINPAVPGSVGTGTEPGIFYDDGGDGDLLARTENLFDTTLGGGEDGLANGGGLSLQAAFLDDVELEVILRAVEKQERSEEIVAPRILVYNNTRAHMSALRHTSYIRDFEVEIAQAAAVANPIVDVVRDGVVLDVRPVVSADRRFITLELRPTVVDLALPIPTFSTTLGSGQPVNIQLPTLTLSQVRTTVTVPDGSTLMLGGTRLSERQRQVSGVPFLKDLPGLSFLFSRKGNYISHRKLLILIRASIILTEEHTPDLLPDQFGDGYLARDAR